MFNQRLNFPKQGPSTPGCFRLIDLVQRCRLQLADARIAHPCARTKTSEVPPLHPVGRTSGTHLIVRRRLEIIDLS